MRDSSRGNPVWKPLTFGPAFCGGDPPVWHAPLSCEEASRAAAAVFGAGGASASNCRGSPSRNPGRICKSGPRAACGAHDRRESASGERSFGHGGSRTNKKSNSVARKGAVLRSHIFLSTKRPKIMTPQTAGILASEHTRAPLVCLGKALCLSAACERISISASEYMRIPRWRQL